MSEPDALAVLHAAMQRLPDPFDVAPVILAQYQQKFGVYPNVIQPRGFNEKIQARKIFDRRPILQIMADKVAVRDYVAERVGRAVLPAWLYLTEDPADLPFALLPERYVLKATHGSGWVVVVGQHDATLEPKLIEVCRDWLARNYFDQSLEWAYRAVPRRIAVEEFLDNGAGGPAEDYKFFTFNGRVEYLQVDLTRFTGHKKNFYDRYWKPLPLRQEADNAPFHVPKPANLAALIDCAETLAKGLDFVRVDLYSVGGKVYFGEMTATPGNGFFRFDPPEFDLEFGKLWQMDISTLGGLLTTSRRAGRR